MDNATILSFWIRSKKAFLISRKDNATTGPILISHNLIIESRTESFHRKPFHLFTLLPRTKLQFDRALIHQSQSNLIRWKLRFKHKCKIVVTFEQIVTKDLYIRK